jgi:hypothetical protein
MSRERVNKIKKLRSKLEYLESRIDTETDPEVLKHLRRELAETEKKYNILEYNEYVHSGAELERLERMAARKAALRRAQNALVVMSE